MPRKLTYSTVTVSKSHRPIVDRIKRAVATATQGHELTVQEIIDRALELLEAELPTYINEVQQQLAQERPNSPEYQRYLQLRQKFG